jgi:aminoglycoside phosphotransferase (APT) family kinase protein
MPTGKMHADEPDIDVALVRRLITAQFPRWAALPIVPVDATGTDNAMFRLGADLVVRLPRVGWAVANIAHEQRWLPRLAPHLPVAIPALAGCGRPDPGAGFVWPWSVLRWLDGENPVAGRVPDPGPLAEDLAAFVVALRHVDPAGGPRARHSLPSRDRATRTAIEALRELREPVDLAAATAVWDAALRLPPWSGPPVWLHGDLSPGNVLLTGGRLGAVIDFGGAGVGDPTPDLLVAWNLLPAAARPVFRAALGGVDDAAWARGRAFALSKALLQLPYYRVSNPRLAANARHVIGEVLAEVGAGDAQPAAA